MKFKSKFYVLNKEIKNRLENGFRFTEVVKLTKIDSSIPNINICNYLKLPIPIMHREFFRIISRKAEFVETFCNSLNNPFHFACRRWILYW